MLLLIDAGNTRIKWALVERGAHKVEPLGRWVASGSAGRDEADTLVQAWQPLQIARVLLANVAGQEMRHCLENALLRSLGSKPVPIEWFKSLPELAGVRNGYREPEQLGCDRFASVIGAHALFPGQSLIVATCGTATTVDAVTGDGEFVGGMILPGLELMARALADHTAQLPHVQNSETITPFADHTDAAIAAGCLAAQSGAIERAATAFAQRQDSPVLCVISGGAASMIAPHLSIPCNHVDNLVLVGLQAVAAAEH